MNQIVGKFLNFLHAANFLRQERKFHDMKVLVKIVDLRQVLLLHLVSDTALLTAVLRLGIEQLIDDYTTSNEVYPSDKD